MAVTTNKMVESNLDTVILIVKSVLQLIHHIPESGLSYQRIPPSSTCTREPEQSSGDREEVAAQRDRNRDEV